MASATTKEARPWSLWAASLVVAAALTGWVGWLVARAQLQGYAQSFDPLIYTRALWGLAHGDLHNPTLEMPSLAVHGNFLLFFLAPLARLFHPATVLAWAQAAALGASAAQVAWAFGRAWAERRPAWAAGWVALWAGALASFGAPLVLNPFLYDLHPELLGVPLLLAGMLRVQAKGAVDAAALAWAGLACLAREEFGLLVAALAFLPPPEVAQHPLRARLAVGAAGVGYFCVYVFGVAQAWGKPWETFALKFAQAAAPAPSEVGVASHKALLLVVLLASMGGVVWRGWRWMGVCIPGVLYFMFNGHLVHLQFKLHYGFLLAPGILAAGVVGWRSWMREPKRGVGVWLAAWSLMAGGIFLVFGAAPGGALFWPKAFDMEGQGGRVRLSDDPHSRAARLHALLARVPPEDGVAAPFQSAPPLGARAFVMTDEWLKERLAAKAGLPPALDTVAVTRADWPSLGRYLAGSQGFRLVGHEEGLALLTRSPRMADLRLDPREVALDAPPASCERPLGGWPEAGLELCALGKTQDHRLVATVRRAKPPAPAWEGRRVEVVVHSQDEGVLPTPLWLMGGILGAQEAPLGGALTLTSQGPTGILPAGVGLLDPRDGRPLPAQDAQGRPHPWVPLAMEGP
jgi:uncharacterized membrane protein